MPLYDYVCTKCGRISEVRHGFGESHTEPCESCGGALRRVFNPAPVHFKGSGFYVTDSRRSAASSGKPEKPKEEPTTAAAPKADTAAPSESKSASKSSDSAA